MSPGPTPSVRGIRFRGLGTAAAVLVTDPGAVGAALGLVAAEMNRVDGVASRFRADSELFGLWQAGGRAVPVSDELWDLVAVALRAARLSDGAVDPTVGAALCRAGYDRDFALVAPDGPEDRLAPETAPGWQSIELDERTRTVRTPGGTLLDLGATAKALVADRAAAAVAERCGCGALVSLGGDLATAGPAPPGGWTVGVDGGERWPPPAWPAVSLPTVAITGGGAATSGTAARQWRRGGQVRHHLIDPGTGLPADSCWQAVTVAAASCLDANIASTGALIKGEEALSWLADWGLPARLVATSGEVHTLCGWPAEEAA
ncbi:MAG: FAD:protein FMN transferase [Acidimicrobiales bacterium]|nr:FAD:protein FMN transferase [Acidimicrobiales bacterium]